MHGKLIVMPVWNEICHAYSLKKLAIGSDKLVALSGVTSLMASLLGYQPEEYLAGQFDPYSGILTSQELITRSHLANWDASARSWLQSADEAKSQEQRRLMLALEKVEIPILNESTVLESVVKIWTTALRVMDSVIRGVAQRVQDGIVLLGLSSWHIYPDLHLLGETIALVKQHDSLVAPGGLLTFGLQMNSDHSDNISWSMPLSYLRYYGDPVMSKGSLPTQNTRITPDELTFVALGCVLGDWTDNQTGLLHVAALFPVVYQALERTAEEEQGRLQLGSLSHFLRWPSWFSLLSTAAAALLESEEKDRERYYQLLRLGRRRPQFLGPTYRIPRAFGLESPSRLLRILHRTQDRISFLRKLAVDNHLCVENHLIYCRIHPQSSELSSYVIYASVAPIMDQVQTSSSKRSFDGSTKEIRLCASWIEGDPSAPNYDIPEEVHFQLDQPLAASFVLTTLYDFDGFAFVRLLDGSITSQGTIEKQATPRLIMPTFKVHLTEIIALLSTKKLSLLSLLNSLSGLRSQFSDGHRLYRSQSWSERDTLCCQESLFGLEVILDLYRLMPSATISTAITLRPLCKAKWVERSFFHWKDLSTFKGTRQTFHLSLSQAFACIAYCESGSCDLEPSLLLKVFALSAGNSIFVAGRLLCDPVESARSMETRRLIGNVGRAGLLFLVPPHDPRIRPVEEENWRLINHDPFNGKLEDSFSQTTMHLSFTDFVWPLSVEYLGNRDSDAFLIESVISVHHQGKWIADLDILPAFNPHVGVHRVRTIRECCLGSHGGSPPQMPMVDTWEEFLEYPEGAFIVRAHRNWMARLAFAAISMRRGHIIICLPENPCWNCCGASISNQTEQTRSEMPSTQIPDASVVVIG